MPSEIDILFENQLLAYYWALVEMELSSGSLKFDHRVPRDSTFGIAYYELSAVKPAKSLALA